MATIKLLIFGNDESDSGLSKEEEDNFGTALDYASTVSGVRLRLGDFYGIYQPWRFVTACSTVRRYATHFVKKALANGVSEVGDKDRGGGRDFIVGLYEELKDTALVRDQLVTVLAAGRDTTACLLSWTL